MFRGGCSDILLGGEVVLADVVAEQGEHGDHERTFHRHAIDHLPAGLKDALDLLQSLVKLLGPQMLQDADQQDSIELVVSIGHVQHIPVPQVWLNSQRCKDSGDLPNVTGEVQPEDFLVHIVEVEKRESTSKTNL